jgi:hypothetical protein
MRKITQLGVASIGAIFAQYNNGILSSRICQLTSEQRVQHWALNKVLKRLRIKLTPKGQIPTPIVHCDASRIPHGGGRTTWLSTLKGYALKLSPAIDDIQR